MSRGPGFAAFADQQSIPVLQNFSQDLSPAVMMYIRCPLSLWNVEDLLHQRGIDISHETVRFWWYRFGPVTVLALRQPARSNQLFPFTALMTL